MTIPESLAMNVVRSSVVMSGEATWGIARTAAGRQLFVLAPMTMSPPAGIEGDVAEYRGARLIVGPASPSNAAILRKVFAWLVPRPLGTSLSAGFGDRLGLATPGHIHAMRTAGRGIRPVFAQQSIREMARTERSPQQVVDDAMWGVFTEGWRSGYGADADHLKETADVDRCLAAGFTLFTVDPGSHVDPSAGTADGAALEWALAALPWADVDDTPAAMRERYLGRAFECDGLKVLFDERSLARAAVKYGRAVAHVAKMFRHLEARAAWPFELEVSVDETDLPTSHAEHFYVASELARLGVRWVALAPRFVGRFEKGVDYIGDLAAFERDFAGHAAIARSLGPYKLSLHSGSDKFSIYPLAAGHARGLVHLKTAGTSYLEAVRTVAGVDAALFREIYAFAMERYETDRASYHVSASLAEAPAAETMADADLPSLLDDFQAREILHVTFGSVLTAVDAGGERRFKNRLLSLLSEHQEAYSAALERHFDGHLAPFVKVGTVASS